jgi:hypothetical protein
VTGGVKRCVRDVILQGMVMMALKGPGIIDHSPKALTASSQFKSRDLVRMLFGGSP